MAEKQIQPEAGQQHPSTGSTGSPQASSGQGQVQIRATDQDLKGNYSNAMNVVHTQEEFVLDFLNILPPTGSLLARIIVSPGHLKRISQALQENLRIYEQNFGSLTPAEAPKGEIGFKIS